MIAATLVGGVDDSVSFFVSRSTRSETVLDRSATVLSSAEVAACAISATRALC